MKVGIIGGSGFIGSHLSSYLSDQNYEVLVFSRNKQNLNKFQKKSKVRFLQMQEPETKHFEDLDILINLAGESILAKKWNKKFKQKLFDSRINQTKAMVKALLNCKKPPKKLINASAIGFYGAHLGECKQVNEDSTRGSDFLSDLSYAWEKPALELQNIQTIIIRIGIVLSKQGGALHKMLTFFKAGLGGAIGNGRQMMSWIHLDDVLQAILFLINSQSKEKIYNLTAPNPVSNLIFSKNLAKSLFRPCLFPVPAFMLKILYGEGSDILLKGQNVYPKNLIQQGYKFQYNFIHEAFNNIFS